MMQSKYTVSESSRERGSAVAKPRTPFIVYVFGILLLLVLASGVCVTERFMAERHTSNVRAETQNQLYAVRDRLEHVLVSNLHLAQGMVAAIAMNPDLAQADFEKAAGALMHDDSMLLSMSAAPDLVIRMVTPLSEGFPALGLDLQTQPQQRIAVEMARDRKRLVLEGPTELVEGGRAFVARMPVYFNDGAQDDVFWGVVNALIDEQRLYRDIGFDNLNLQSIDIAIRSRYLPAAVGDVFFGRPEVFDGNPVLAEIPLPVGYWEVAAVPRMTVADPMLWQVRTVYGGVSLVMLGVFFAMFRGVSAAALARAQAEHAQHQLALSLTSLHEREALLRTVIDEIPDVLVLKDKHGNFLLANETVARLYNTTPALMVGKDDADFGVPKDMSDFFRENVKSVMQRGETEVVFEDSTDTKTGEVRHFKSIKKPFKDAQGEDQILVIAHDITDVVEARKRVEESEQKLRTILDNVDAYIYLKDMQGRYLFANRSVRNLWNATMDELVGQGDEAFFDAETAANIRKNDAVVLEDGKTLRTEETNEVVQSGEVFTYQSTKLPLRDERGDIYALCGISVDISDIKRIEFALRESEQRFKIAGQAAYDLIYEWDVASDSLTWFGDIDGMLGFDEGGISHSINSWLALIHPEDTEQLADAVEQHRSSTQPISYSYRIRHHDGSYRYWSDHALPLVTEAGRPYKWIGVCTDVTTQKLQQQELEFRAYHDKLTNLPNRLLLSDRLRQAMYQEVRRGQQLAVIYIDLDGFKQVNDTYGHDVGDQLLVAIAQRFERVLRNGDTVARLGGDEFVAVMIDMADTAKAIPLLRRMLKLIAEPVLVNNLVLQVSASLGVAFYPQQEEVDADQLLRQADQAMYQAKLKGKNRYYFFDTERDRSLRGQLESQERIADGMLNGELELRYQPKVNMRTGKVIGMEALIRWNHPEEGLLGPNKILPVIEDHPLSIELGEWVIKEALKQQDEWRRQGLHIPVSVNIDGTHLQQNTFVMRLQALLAAWPDASPEDLELEVLETSALQDIHKVSVVMKTCQDIGVKFALDDFGTGYSSLTYLKHLPAATLKIDRSFVRDMLDDPDDLAILEGVVGMATAFRRNVIAEGVERIEHGSLLLQLGCELGQGYAISQPLIGAQVPVWISQWTPPPVWQQQKQISRDDLSLVFAAIEHRAWLRALENYIRDVSQPLPPLAWDSCRFGQWLKGEGQKRYGSTDLYSQVHASHDKIHRCGEQLVELVKEQQIVAAAALVSELHALSDALLASLEILLNSEPPERLEAKPLLQPAVLD